MLMSSHMTTITTLRYHTSLGPLSTISIQLLAAISLVVVVALPAIQARIRLCSNTHSLTLLDQGNLGTDANSRADDFYSHRPINQLPFLFSSKYVCVDWQNCAASISHA